MNQLRKSTADKAGKLIGDIIISDAALQAATRALHKLDPKDKGCIFDLQELYNKIAHWSLVNRGASQELIALETAETGASTIKVISITKNRAQIVIQNKEENGKKVSLTRHLRLEGGKWRGHSLFGTRIVNYDLPSKQQAADLPLAA
jgi:hypothetical protein